jgi:hypothetical protein
MQFDANSRARRGREIVDTGEDRTLTPRGVIDQVVDWLESEGGEA